MLINAFVKSALSERVVALLLNIFHIPSLSTVSGKKVFVKSQNAIKPNTFFIVEQDSRLFKGVLIEGFLDKPLKAQN